MPTRQRTGNPQEGHTPTDPIETAQLVEICARVWNGQNGGTTATLPSSFIRIPPSIATSGNGTCEDVHSTTQGYGCQCAAYQHGTGNPLDTPGIVSRPLKSVRKVPDATP